uniref:Retrotransposon protein, putative, Ty1-copia subclass n=1 Tax=Tanacetum cinerariifolium TaxID=118510 RepID=A0A6L2N8T6_TANCI|nr:retrotransposon protein, putative, Ty1-copia subclass [Tanacetum cinerariifolium]
MTTSVVTNSVFRVFFEKQKLPRPNFIDWYRQLRIILSVEDKLDYLEQPIHHALVLAQAEQELLYIVRDFHSYKLEEGQSVSSYVLKMKSYIDNLERLGHPMSFNLGMTTSVVTNSVFRVFFEKQKLPRPNFIDWYRQLRIILSVEDKLDYLEQPIHHALVLAQAENLSAYDMLWELKTLFAQQAEQELLYIVRDFHSYKLEEGQSNYNMHSMGKMVNELHAILKLHEQTLTKKDHALHVIRAAELLKNKKLSHGASSSGIFKIELYTFPNKSWFYDTGCGTHICNTTQGLKGSRKSKPGALSLYVGNGQRAAVEAIGTYHLCLPSRLVIVLNNFHYAPSITRGIISFSRLYDDGYVNYFVDNVILVSRNNLVYFSDVLRDGIFEIDLSNSNTIDSSMYAQASRQWNKRFDDEIKKFGFTQNRDEPCVYLKSSGSNVTFLILYVDDILIIRNHIPMLQDVKSYIGRCFAMKDLGEAAYILGIKISRDRSLRLIGLCQSTYIDKVLRRFHMENSKCGSILMQEKLRLSKSQGASTHVELKHMQNVPYASAMGFIMYVVRPTRPDVAFAQNITNRFQQNLGVLYWTTVKNILKYLRNTKYMFIVYKGDIKRELRVSCYTDAGYLTDVDDLKS